MKSKIVPACLFFSISGPLFATSRLECVNFNRDFLKLKKVANGSWDLAYSIDDPIDGISRKFEGEREDLKCKFDSNWNLAPAFYCVADDGWKAAFTVTIESAFDTKADLDLAKIDRYVSSFTFRLVTDRASKVFLGKAYWQKQANFECKWN